MKAWMRHTGKKGETQTGQALLLLVLILLFSIFFIVLRPKLLAVKTLASIGFQFPELGVLTIAMTMAMIIGGINLSLIAASNFAGIVMVSILRAGGGLWAVIPVGIAVCLLIGLLNGCIIALFHVPDILATLSTQMLLGGLSLVITRGGVVSVNSPALSFLGMGSVFGIPVPLLIFAAAVSLAAAMLGYTQLGWQMYLYGSNPVVSDYNGTCRVLLIMRTHVLSGLFTGIAAVIMTARFSSASASYASSYLLQTVLIAVLGGVNPDGGSGKIGNLVLAVLLVQVLSTGFNALRMDSHVSSAILGLVLIATVFIRRLRLLRISGGE